MVTGPSDLVSPSVETPPLHVTLGCVKLGHRLLPIPEVSTKGLRVRTSLHTAIGSREQVLLPTSLESCRTLEDCQEMAKLDCCPSPCLDRTESELPKPASPKVSRSTTEIAASAEDMTRRSKLGVGEKSRRAGNPSPPMSLDHQKGQQ